MTFKTVFVLLALGTWAGSAGNAGAAVISIDYTVSVFGLPVGTARLKADLDGDIYRLGFSGRVRGPMRLFANGAIAAHVNGSIEAGVMIPAQYNHRYVSAGKVETVRFRFAHGHIEDVYAAPPRRHPERYLPITPEQLTNVLDPLSALVRPSGAAKPDACGPNLPLFDGRERFDLALRYSRSETTNAAGLSSTSAIVCAVRYIPISGHRPGKKSVRDLEANDDIEVWFATLDGAGVTVPVQLRMRTEFGRLIIVATRASLT